MRTDKDVIIVGAGLTGLALGVKLKHRGIDFIITEKDAEAGGVISTGEENGFVYEKGPNTGVYSTPELVELFDLLGGLCELEKADKSAAKRYIWKNGKWRAIPSGLFSAVATPLFSLWDKFRILGEPFRKPGTDPYESVAGLVRRRMGKSFLDYAVNPFISGVYAGDPEKLITKFALPKLYNLEQNYGSFIKGAIKKAKEDKTELERRATKEVFSVKGGLGKLIEAMVGFIGEENIVLQCENTEINHEDGLYTVRTDSAAGKAEYVSRSLVTTTGSESLENLLSFTGTKTLSAVTSVNHARIVQVAAGFNEWKGMPLDAFGGLVPSRENRKVLGILFPSAIFTGRAPKGGALLSVFMGGYRNPQITEKTDSEIKDIVMDELKNMMGTGDNKPDMIKIFRYEKAIPQYELSSEERFRAIGDIESRFPGLHIAGNIRDGIGMADRVKQAGQLAAAIEDYTKKKA
ncbi:MAG: protoporphyrinogen oxidase [Bacteroidales bacterium]|nr:protoporphyrinogen oxidase [Bacteroidales bacterium]